MTPTMKLLWLFLFAQAGEGGCVQVSIETMCDRLALRPQSVVRAVRALVDKGHIERIRLGRYHSAAIYRVVEQPAYLDKVA